MLSAPPPPDLARQKGVPAVPRFRALRVLHLAAEHSGNGAVGPGRAAPAVYRVENRQTRSVPSRHLVRPPPLQPDGCTDLSTGPGRAHCIATPPRPNTTAVSERVHRLNYWPWAGTLHRHATTPEHYCRVQTGAPTKLLALGAHIAPPRHHARTLLPCPNGCTA